MAKEKETINYVIIDATDLIIGRMGSRIAKRLLLGESFKIVNCKDAVFLGNKNYLLKKYKDKLNNKVVKQGPYYSRNPAALVRRSFRNMLPYKNARGVSAYKRLLCYNSTPSTLIKANKEIISQAKINKNEIFYYVKVSEISKSLGYERKK